MTSPLSPPASSGCSAAAPEHKGLQPGDIGLQPGDLGLQPGDLGLQDGCLGLHPLAGMLIRVGGCNPNPTPNPGLVGLVGGGARLGPVGLGRVGLGLGLGLA